MNRSMPGLPVHHHLLKSTQTHVHRVHDAIQPMSSSVVPFSSCPQSLPVQGLFQRVNSSHQVAKALEFQLQHQSFQRTATLRCPKAPMPLSQSLPGVSSICVLLFWGLSYLLNSYFKLRFRKPSQIGAFQRFILISCIVL